MVFTLGVGRYCGRCSKDMVSFAFEFLNPAQFCDVCLLMVLTYSMACAIREAYAATLTVLILVEGRPSEDEDGNATQVR